MSSKEHIPIYNPEIKRRWLRLIDHFGEHHVRAKINETRTTRKAREELETRLDIQQLSQK